MKKITGSAFWVVLSLMVLTMSLDANAARMGSGKSFGSRPSYSAPYQKSPSSSPGSTAQQPGYRQPQTAPNAGLRDSMARRSGLMGMLGGLAIGGLLGSMFMGGAFEHFNFMDMLVFGVLAYVAYRLLAGRTRRATAAYETSSASSSYGHEGPERVMHRHATGPGFETDILSGRSQGGFGPGSQTVSWPRDFDADHFVHGAESAYRHLQSAWDAGDLATLRSLTTDKVFAELQEQIRGRTEANRTEVHKVEVEILDVRDISPNREATVRFNVLMRESGNESPRPVEEVWHFIKPLASKQPTWFLDGIQQLEG